MDSSKTCTEMSSDEWNLRVYEACHTVAESINELIDLLCGLTGMDIEEACNDNCVRPFIDILGNLQAQSAACEGGRLDLIALDIIRNYGTGKSDLL